MPKWTVAQAKAKLSEVIDRAVSSGPQIVTRNGVETVVVVAVEEWEKKTKRRGSLIDFLASSPLKNSGLKIDRSKSKSREICQSLRS
jgi:prevent-host-death family protein